MAIATASTRAPCSATAALAAPRCSAKAQRLTTFSGMKAIGQQPSMRVEQRLAASRPQVARASRSPAVIEARCAHRSWHGHLLPVCAGSAMLAKGCRARRRPSPAANRCRRTPSALQEGGSAGCCRRHRPAAEPAAEDEPHGQRAGTVRYCQRGGRGGRPVSLQHPDQGMRRRLSCGWQATLS